jgi:hypothetical protein
MQEQQFQLLLPQFLELTYCSPSFCTLKNALPNLKNSGFSSGLTWALINGIQLLNLLLLMNMNIPENLRTFLSDYLGFACFDFFGAPFTTGIKGMDFDSFNTTFNGRFEENGYETRSVILNYESQLLVWIIYLASIPFVLLGAKYFKFKVLLRIKEGFLFNTVILALIECYSEITLVTFLNCYEVCSLFHVLLICFS